MPPKVLRLAWQRPPCHWVAVADGRRDEEAAGDVNQRQVRTDSFTLGSPVTQIGADDIVQAQHWTIVVPSSERETEAYQLLP